MGTHKIKDYLCYTKIGDSFKNTIKGQIYSFSNVSDKLYTCKFTLLLLVCSIKCQNCYSKENTFKYSIPA